MTVPSVRHSKRMIDAIIAKGSQKLDPKVIVNRMDNRKNVAGLNAGDVAAALGDRLIGSIPNNYSLVRDAVDRGVQLGDIEPDNNVTRALSTILQLDEAGEAKITKPGNSLFAYGRKILSRKAS